MRSSGYILAVLVIAGMSLLSVASCATESGHEVNSAKTIEDSPQMPALPRNPEPEPSPQLPDLQAEIADGRYRNSTSPLASFDFLNYSYPLPRGWQNPDGSDAKLENGKLAPVSEHLGEDIGDEEKARRKAERRIGLSHVATKYFDATGDGEDEAVVILKIETGGSAIPQVVYVFEWKNDAPNLLWHFRTGDRSDGGLKDIRPDSGMLLLELFGQDRYMLGEIETGKITGDEVQLCCPTHFTRTWYKWNGKHFIRQGDRLTFLTSDPSAEPLVNFGDIMNDPVKSKKFLESQKNRQ
ncbi:hypothetical protein [Leptolyngbya sp. 7M]|uniref:hypothetical protein n=1 Tax=Leptolyngbya sp. 7M TaxID=2812896 RepID=UPI001B8B859A|nr:hypothetical protein [Leptolyngbya sp. 7M]QYO65630.1 hypothetical protein JVX88_02240 [Leptolyngbya sp. 7M]